MRVETSADLSPVGTGVGAEIKRRREAVGLTVAGLAREARVSRTTLHHIETGETESPHDDVLGRIHRALSAAEAESGVTVVASETPDVEMIEFEVEGAFGVRVVRARGPKGDHELLRDDVIAIIKGIQQGTADAPE